MTAHSVERFCVTHQLPLLPAEWYDECISLGDYRPGSPFHVANLDGFWHEARPIAYGAAGSYVLPIALSRSRSTSNLVEVSSFRKRVLSTREGKEAAYYPTMRELSFTEASARPELAFSAPHSDYGFLVSQPVIFEKSLLHQYKKVHHRKDILGYVSLAVKMGILDDKSAAELLNARQIIPGGAELGVYPRNWLMETLSQLERLGRAFLYRYGRRVRRYDAYQVRAVGFLSERLGSFLLLRHIQQEFSGNVPSDIFGYMTTIVEGNSGYRPGKANQ